jgi:hypothetical protein
MRYKDSTRTIERTNPKSGMSKDIIINTNKCLKTQLNKEELENKNRFSIKI